MSVASEPLVDLDAEALRPRFELRSTPRAAADHPLELHIGGISGALAGRTRDIGISGVCAATSSPFALSGVHRVTIDLPGGRVSLPAEGRWQRESRRDSVVLTGLRFVDIEPKTLDLLWDLVMDSGKRLARFMYSYEEHHGLGVEEALGISQISRYRDVHRGEMVYAQETDRAGEDSIYLVLHGAVVLQLRVRGAREAFIARLGPGELFGGTPLIANVPHAETAVADVDTRLVEIDRASFAYLLAVKPWLAQQLGLSLNRAQGRRLRDAFARVRDAL
ncbi:MAG TPA: cyclic nucleotide-binding domain-containing protein [Myxococcota bacterium]|nr:cyclic nucleotide-binding domain-containing protein [Myxococcota bacterium]